MGRIDAYFQSGNPPKIDPESKEMIKSQLHHFLSKDSIEKPGKKKNGFFKRLFGSQEKTLNTQNYMPTLSLKKKIYLVADNILTPLTLSTNKMVLALDEEESVQFYLMILMAKSSDWSGGKDLVEVRIDENNKPFVFNLKIEGYSFINSTDALELASLLSRLMDSGISSDDGLSTDDIFLENRDFTNRVIAVISSGEVNIEVG